MAKNEEFLDIDGINAQKAFEQNPEAKFARKEHLAKITKIAENYPDEVNLDFLVLLFVQGFSNEEIAKLKGVTKNYVQYKIGKSLKFLRKKMNQKEYK